MFLTHGRGGQRFNSVKNPVRDLSNYRAAKQNRDLFRKLYMIYEKRTIPHAAVGTDAYGFFCFAGKARSGLLRREQGLIILLSRPSGIEPLADPLCGQLFRMQDQRGRMVFRSISKGFVFPAVRC